MWRTYCVTVRHDDRPSGADLEKVLSHVLRNHIINAPKKPLSPDAALADIWARLGIRPEHSTKLAA
jgi:hypothetical protein